MIPFASNSRRAFLARLPLIFNRSTRTLTLTNRYEPTSLKSLSYVGLSRRTALLALSLTLPLDHFFFLAGKCQYGVDIRGWEPDLPWVEGPAALAMVGDGLTVRTDSWWRKEQSQSGG